MNDIDLDAISELAHHKYPLSKHGNYIREYAMMKQAIHQALVLASENTEITYDSAGNQMVNKQSILDVEKLIK